MKFQAKENASSMTLPCTKARCKLRLAQQKLWIDHVLWTRNFIIAAIKAYNEGEEHMIMFADTLAMGIIKQFPEKFK